MLLHNRDQIKLALTIATRKRSITQQVHFSAEVSKSMAFSELWDLCLREQEINPHTDSRDMEPLNDKQHERTEAQTMGITQKSEEKVTNMLNFKVMTMLQC